MSNKKYFRISDIRDSALKKKKEVSERGKSTGFKSLDPYISYIPGYTTTVFSYAGQGKTQFCVEELVYLSEHYGDKNVCYLTEAGDAAETALDIAQTYKRKVLIQMTDEDVIEAFDWMEEHFFILDISKDLMNIREIYETVVEIEKVEGVKINNVLIDHYHNIPPTPEMQSATIADKVKYIYQAITRTSKKFNLHTFILFHVRDTDPVKCPKSNQYYLPKPEMYMLSGGQQSSYLGQQMISIWRPISREEQVGTVDPTTGIPFKLNSMIVTCVKVKPKQSGKIGGSLLMWDWEKQSYYEEEGFGKRMYAGDHLPKSQTPTLKPNLNFDKETNWLD